MFSTHGYACSSTNILPRVDPSPSQLPAAERRTGAQHRQLSFVWDRASRVLTATENTADVIAVTA